MANSALLCPARFDEVYNKLRRREDTWNTNKSSTWGLETPFKSLNKLTGGLHPGVTVWGARTSHGKSAACMQIVFHTAENLAREWIADNHDEPPGQILVFSPEMTADQLMERYATQRSQVPITLIREGKATEEQRRDWLDAADEMTAYQRLISLYAGQQQTQDGIVSELQRAVDEGPPVRLVLVDYLQRIHAGGINGRTGDIATLSGLMDEFQTFAAANEIPVLLASQLNRAIERDNQTGKVSERPPELSDLKGSGSIEEDADCVVLLWRPPEEPHPGKGRMAAQKAVFYVKKNRNGPVGDREMLYYPDILSFADLERGR